MKDKIVSIFKKLKKPSSPNAQGRMRENGRGEAMEKNMRIEMLMRENAELGKKLKEQRNIVEDVAKLGNNMRSLDKQRANGRGNIGSLKMV